MLKHTIPQLRVRTVYDLDLDALWNQGLRAIITDLDNTLVGAREPFATEKLKEWLARVVTRGFRVVILSNNNPARVSAFADPLSIPYVARARKPLAGGFRRALATLGVSSSREVMVLGDQLMTDVIGGNRLGFYTVLVEPIALKDESFYTRNINRRLEKLAIYFGKRAGK